MVRSMKRLAILLAAILTGAGCHRDTARQGPAPVRVAVIGGMVMSGMWQAVSANTFADTTRPA